MTLQAGPRAVRQVQDLPAAVIEEVRTGAVAPLGTSGILSGIGKAARLDPVWFGPLGPDGDAHAETFHGGADKAVLQYDRRHYARWREEFPSSADRLVPGGFGENLVVSGMGESDVCVGDVVRAGGALLQVTESRQPCFKLNHRFGQRSMARRVQETGRTGWLYRVLEPGWVRAGDEVRVVERSLPDWTIAAVQQFLYHAIDDLETAKELSGLELLSPGFRALFARRVENAAAEDWSDRLSNGALAPDDLRWTEVEVVGAEMETADVRSFLLRPTSADDRADPLLADYAAGSHVQVKVANALTRSYSLCTLPSDRGLTIAVAKDPDSRGGSRHLHERVAVGDRLMMTAPRSAFPLHADATEHLLIAGGIGITPFLSMIEELAALDAPWHLHYLVRSVDQAPFAARLLAAHPGSVTLHVSGDGRRLDLGALLGTPVAGAHVYCCGSRGLMAGVREAASSWPDGSVHFEAFGADASGRGGDVPFTATVASTGRVVEVARDQSLLEALREADVPVDSSCESGTCGTCVVGYLRGTVDHRDLVLARAERSSRIITCVSRALGDVRLDL